MYDIRFGANGWRARIDDGFTEENVVRIADALGRTWAPRNEGYTVLVGYDTRRDSKRLAVVVGQVLAAFALMPEVAPRTLLSYLAVLMAVGLVTGALTGVLAREVLKRMKRFSLR